MMQEVQPTRHAFAIAIVVGISLAFPAQVRSQDARRQPANEARSQTTQGDLDSRLLEGLGGLPGTKSTVPAKASHQAGRAVPAVGGTGDPIAEGSDVGPRNPLVQIGREMRRVEGLLIQRRVSSETQRTQQQIVTQLDALIDALAAAQQAQQKRKPSSTSKGSQKMSKAGKQAARNGGGQTKEGGGDLKQAAMQGEVGDFWGHLPQRLRRQMRSAEAIEFLPKYRKLIEDYYKRLAEDRGLQQ